MNERFEGLSSSAIGDIGEETVRAHLEERGDLIVALGDSGMARTAGRQDLDLIIVSDGELVAVEVKTRFLSSKAGHLTPSGNLLRPRLRRPTLARPRQGSQEYLRPRLAPFISVTEEGFDISARVCAVDLRAELLQWFPLSREGRVLAPSELPVGCSVEIEEGVQAILGHRGHL